MLWNSIASRVKRVIAQRVKMAQKEHDEACKKYEEVYKNTVSIAERTRDYEIEDHATQMVNKIIGKI